VHVEYVHRELASFGRPIPDLDHHGSFLSSRTDREDGGTSVAVACRYEDLARTFADLREPELPL
jgi:hypothetical protein